MVTTGAVRCAKLQSNHHHQQTNTQFSTGRMPFLSPNQQCQSTEGQQPQNRLVNGNGEVHLLWIEVEDLGSNGAGDRHKPTRIQLSRCLSTHTYTHTHTHTHTHTNTHTHTHTHTHQHTHTHRHASYHSHLTRVPQTASCLNDFVNADKKRYVITVKSLCRVRMFNTFICLFQQSSLQQ